MSQKLKAGKRKEAWLRDDLRADSTQKRGVIINRHRHTHTYTAEVVNVYHTKRLQKEVKGQESSLWIQTALKVSLIRLK